MLFGSPRSLLLLAGIASLAACNGGSATAPTPYQAAVPQSHALAQSVRADVRFGLDLRSLSIHRAPRGFDHRPSGHQPTLFVSDLDTQAVELYPAGVKNPQQTGMITTGINLPINDAVDAAGTVYVANNGNSTVTEYPWGETSPSVTLSDSLVYPNGIAVDKQGTVYVTSGAVVGQCYILEFPKGATSPSVQVNGFGLPIGLAIDKNDNLYVADAESGNYKVWEVPKGSTTPQDLHLVGLADPVGLAINGANNLYVTNDEPGQFKVLAFHLGQTTAFATITAGLDGPYSIAFQRNGNLFVGNSFHFPGSVSGYHKGRKNPFETFSNGVENPAGLAVYPAPRH